MEARTSSAPARFGNYVPTWESRLQVKRAWALAQATQLAAFTFDLVPRCRGQNSIWQPHLPICLPHHMFAVRSSKRSERLLLFALLVLHSQKKNPGKVLEEAPELWSRLPSATHRWECLDSKLCQHRRGQRAVPSGQPSQRQRCLPPRRKCKWFGLEHILLSLDSVHLFFAISHGGNSWISSFRIFPAVFTRDAHC